jgi:AcrR family transcriptional regulator
MSRSAKKRTQAERSEATRAALIGAGRRLFAERGYAGVGTEEIVREAGVTRGALYHHFEDKRDLLRSVYEQIEGELSQRLAESLVPGAGVIDSLHAGAETFLDQCLDPEVQQIALLDAPAVLGWEEWRKIAARYAAGLVDAMLAHGMETGEVRRQPVRSLTHALIGAVDELAMMVARAADPDAARAEASVTLATLIDALRPTPA